MASTTLLPGQDNPGQKPNREQRRSIARAHKRHQRDVFHARITDGAHFMPPMDIPIMQAVEYVPKGFVPFSEAMKPSCRDFDMTVDFYEDDYEIERIWTNTDRYLEKLSKFAAVVAPDLSVCWDFPAAMQVWNTYRNQVLGSYFQRKGMLCIPNVRCDPGKPWMLDGIPRNSTIAIGARSCVKKVEDRVRFTEAVRFAVDTLQPSCILWYGSAAYGVSSYPESLHIPLHFYPARVRGRMGGAADGEIQ